jgi:uncharacterized membrane protein
MGWALSSERKPKERDMQRLIMTAAAAAMLSAGVMAATSAKADHNFGPMKSGTQCYKGATNGWGNQGYGYWTACPNKATAPAAKQAKGA